MISKVVLAAVLAFALLGCSSNGPDTAQEGIIVSTTPRGEVEFKLPETGNGLSSITVWDAESGRQLWTMVYRDFEGSEIVYGAKPNSLSRQMFPEVGRPEKIKGRIIRMQVSYSKDSYLSAGVKTYLRTLTIGG